MRTPTSLLVLLTIGCSDSTIKSVTEPPAVTIQTPPAGSELDQAVAVSLRGLVEDDKFSESLDSLDAQWSVDGEAICEGSIVDAGGNIDCVYSFPTAGDVTLQLTVTNPDGESGTAENELTIVPNGAPQAEILLPTAGGLYYSDVLVDFQATVSDAEDPADALVVTWSSSLDGDLDIDDRADSDGTLEGNTILSEGEHLLTLTVEDTTGLMAEDTVRIDVGTENLAPDCAITAPENNDSFEFGSTVLFEGTATDPDIDADELTVSWTSSLDGELSTAAPTSSGAMAFGADDLSQATHTITLMVEDEAGGTCSDAILVTIGSGPAIEVTAPATGTVYNEGERVSFEGTVSDVDDDATALTIEWSSTLDGTLDGSPSDSSGLIGFTTSGLSRGDHTVSARAEDPDGFYASDSIRLVINGVPDAPEVEIDPASPTSADGLTVSVVTPSTDPDGDVLTYEYTWLRDGETSSYTGETVPVSATTRGEEWTVRVAATDGYGTSDVGSDSVDIGNAPPSLDDVTLTPTSPLEGDTLTCTPGTATDNDGDTVSYRYAWTVDGSAITPTSSTLSGTWFDKGQEVTCTVTPTDGTDDGSPVSSDPVSVENTAPEIGSVSVSPSTAYEATTLTCLPAGASDDDGDDISYSWDWIVDGASLGLDSETIDGDRFDKGQTVACSATPDDGEDEGDTVSSSAITIRNTPPTVASATLSPTSATESTTLRCSEGATDDDDGDPVSLSYGWKIDGGTISTTGTSLTGADFDKGDTVSCFITPNDGEDDGTPVESDAVVVGNTAPTATSVEVTPIDPYTNEDLTATVSGGSDEDGDTVSYSYQWYADGSAISGATSRVLSADDHVKNQEITVVVRPWDGTDYGSSLESDPVTVNNSPPTAPTIVISPTDAEPEDSLSCTISAASSDADGDSITYSYAWYESGVKSTETTSTLSAGDTEHGDSWQCVVTPNDGEEDGTPGSDSQTVADRTSPDRPVIDSIDPYRNGTSVTVSGDAEADAELTLYIDCTDGSLDTEITPVGTDGSWSLRITIPYGEECDFYAYAEDRYGNVSDESNTVTTESCAPTDDYEDATGYGDTCLDSVDEWAILPDDGSSFTLTGNVIDATDEDWYVVDTSQSIGVGGYDAYNFVVEMTAGTADYAFAVYRGGCGTEFLECDDAGTEGDGYLSYDFYREDDGDGSGGHVTPSDLTYCYDGSLYDECDDLAEIYYIHVWRTSDDLSCSYYDLDISNGG